MIHASEQMPRSAVRKTGRRGRRFCLLGGCPNRCTHYGYAGGCALMAGCAFHVAMWVRSPADLHAATERARRSA